MLSKKGLQTLEQNEPVHSKPEGVDWSLDQWTEWVDQWLGVRVETFARDPDVMISLYSGEQKTVQEYHGRELLELLQNADDAGVGYGPNKALIELRRDGLCVANSGISFSTAGVRSLMIADRSPKQLDRNRYVGNRGLGFRSILNWTTSPAILSGQLQLGYSPQRAAGKLEQIRAQSSYARQLVEQQVRIGHECPIPVLSCPMILTTESLNMPLQKRALEFSAEGYDTVIVLPFTRERSYEKVKDQIDDLLKTRELMLFLQNLEKLEIRTESESQAWRVKREQNVVRVLSGEDGESAVEWRVFSRRGQVREEFLDERNRQTPEFEVKIAVPVQGGGGGVLFNYFPTKVQFPYPVVAHATIDLTANRDHLEDSKTNEFLIGQLAEALADAAEASLSADSWRPLRQITKGSGDLDFMLKKFGFEAALSSAAKSKTLIPRGDGSLGVPAATKRLPVETGDWLPDEEFGDLACWTDDYYLRKTLESLGVPTLSAEEFRNRLNRVSPRVSILHRAKLIVGLVRHASGHIPQNPGPQLLVQADGTLIDADAVAYIPSGSQQTFTLPEWLTLRFVSPELVDLLVEELKVSRKDLAVKLRCLNLNDYDFGELASAINARINERCRKEGIDERVARLEGIYALKGLFESVTNDAIPKRRADLRAFVLTRNGEWKHADEMYLGDPYPGGGLMEALVGALHPEDFVAPPAKLGHDGDVGRWEALLRWLGAEVAPREQKIDPSVYGAHHYVEHVRRSLQYPAKFDDCVAATAEELSPISLSNLISVEYIDEILNSANPEAVLAWVAKDARIESWRVNGDTSAKFQARFRSYTDRPLTNQPLPSYVLWMLRCTPWLPTTDGQKAQPLDCVQARITNQEIQKTFPRPAVDYDGELFQKLSLDHESLRMALYRLGVCMSLDDLPWERCYEVLLRLPDNDDNGRAAMSFYRMLAEKAEDIDLESLHARKEFRRVGKLWSRLGESWEYRSVSEKVFFVADATVPAAVLQVFPIIELRRGRGVEKLQKVFCAQALRAADINIEVRGHELKPRAEVLNDAVTKLKPFVLALRFAANPDATGVQRLKKIQVVACSGVEATARVSESEIPIHLIKVGESLICGDTAYLITDDVDPENPLDDAVTADCIANILASVLQVDQTNEFARLATAKHEARQQVLSLILQHDGSDALRSAREALALPDEEEHRPHGSVRLPLLAGAISPASPGETDFISREAETEATSTNQQPPLPRDISSKQLGHKAPPVRTVPFRVRSERTKREQVQHIRRVTDGGRCEKLAQLYETEQGRFPFLVGSMQGEQAFGCDLISFATEADCSEFQEFLKQGAKGNLERVVRFIEVKGRGNPSGTIALEGNQLSEAHRRRERYFIYRIYEAVDGQEWHIAILQNPLAYEWPISYSIDPLQRDEAEFWSVTACEQSTDIA